MNCRDCINQLKFVCNKCWTLICENAQCEQGIKKHKDACPNLHITKFDKEIESKFWREYYKKEIKRIKKLCNHISLKTKEIINTVEVLSKYALEKLEKLIVKVFYRI